MEKIVIYGNGSLAHTAYNSFTYDSPHEVVAFTVDKEFIKEDKLYDLPVVPFTEIESAFPPAEYKMFVAVGYVKVNHLRAERYYQVKKIGYQLVSYVNSTAYVSKKMVIGDNCFIGAGCILSQSVRIGNDIVIGAGTYIGHNAIIDDHCFIADHVAVSGSVTIGEYAFLGINSTIRNRVNIARECVIGAGAVILQSTKEKEVYMSQQAERLPILSDQLSIS